MMHIDHPQNFEISREKAKQVGFHLLESGHTLFTIRPDGNIELGEGITPDEASRAFWEALGDANPLKQQLAQAQQETERVRVLAEKHLFDKAKVEGELAQARALLEEANVPIFISYVLEKKRYVCFFCGLDRDHWHAPNCTLVKVRAFLAQQEEASDGE